MNTGARISRWLKALLRRDDRPGRLAEQLAAKQLKRAGYRVVHRNLVIGDDEADLVAIDPDGETLVVVEVKSREAGPTRPEESVGPQKRHRLTRLASRLLARREYRNRRVRFDVMSVEIDGRGGTSIQHHIAAFDSAW